MIVEDALGNQFDSDSRYRRIVSLVPSQTEYIINLIGDSTTYKVLGRTKFCIHPSNKVSDITIDTFTDSKIVPLGIGFYSFFVSSNELFIIRNKFSQVKNYCCDYISNVITRYCFISKNY